MFDEFALPGFLLDAVAQLGWEEPTTIQKLVLPPALEGRDVLGGPPWVGGGRGWATLLQSEAVGETGGGAVGTAGQ